MKGAHSQGMPQLSGPLAANPTSAWSVYTKGFKSQPRMVLVKVLKTALEIFRLFVLQSLS